MVLGAVGAVGGCHARDVGVTSPAEHAATVAGAIHCECAKDRHADEADSALSSLVALAERATELERERDYFQSRLMDHSAAEQFSFGRAEAAEARAEQAQTALRTADDLLRRLDEWDVMNSTHDGPYWKREIAAARAALDEGTSTTPPHSSDRVEQLETVLRRLISHHLTSHDGNSERHQIGVKCRVVHDAERVLAALDGGTATPEPDA